MVREFQKVYEASINLNKTLKETMGDLYHEKNYIDELIRISLNSLNYQTPKGTQLEIGYFIESVIACYESSRPQCVREIANNILSLSQMLGKNPKFMYTVSELIADRIIANKITYKYEDLYNFITENKTIWYQSCKDSDEFFTKEFLSISPELYYILKEANLESILKDFNNNDTYVTSKICTLIVNPLSSALEKLLAQDKALICDMMLLENYPVECVKTFCD